MRNQIPRNLEHFKAGRLVILIVRLPICFWMREREDKDHEDNDDHGNDCDCDDDDDDEVDFADK